MHKIIFLADSVMALENHPLPCISQGLIDMYSEHHLSPFLLASIYTACLTEAHLPPPLRRNGQLSMNWC